LIYLSLETVSELFSVCISINNFIWWQPKEIFHPYILCFSKRSMNCLTKLISEAHEKSAQYIVSRTKKSAKGYSKFEGLVIEKKQIKVFQDKIGKLKE